MNSLGDIFDLLSIDDDEHLSVGYRQPGSEFIGTRERAGDLRVIDLPADRDYWVGLVPIPDGVGRGKANEAERIPALWCDLDVKPGGMASMESAEFVVSELSSLIGSTPVYVTYTGHGIQPVWAIDGDDSRDVPRLTGLLERFGELVRLVARRNGGDRDSVFDTARVLRAPGTVNWKDESDPLPTRMEPRGGRPLSADEIEEVLDTYHVEAPQPGTMDENHPHSDWAWGQSCEYVNAMVNGWRSDPEPRARHPWLFSQTIRLTAARRLGCISEVGHRQALAVLSERMDLWRARDGLRPGEVEECLRYAVPLVESMSEDRCRRELGDHPHTVTAGEMRTMAIARSLVADRLLGRFIYATSKVGWHMWDGRRWLRCDEDDVIREAHEWVLSWLRDLISGGANARTVGEAARYRDIGMLRALVQSARTFSAIRVDPARLDQQPGLLNCANGVVDLRSGRLRPHDPDLYFTLVTPVSYNPDATHGDWDKARSAFADEQVEAWVRRHLGGALTGTPRREDVLVLHHGGGANGKTTILSSALEAFGEFGGILNDRVIVGSTNEHQTIYMSLRGRRLMLMEELPEGHVLPVDRVKKLVETPKIKARGIGQDEIEFVATHSLVISTNYLPSVRETDHGTWRRLAMVDYPHKYEGADRDRTLRQRCATGVAQQEAVLAWLVRGAVEWYRNGQTITDYPPAVESAIEVWRGEADPLGDFLMRYERTGERSHYVAVEQMHRDFNFSLSSGEKAWSATLFGQRLKSHRWMATNDLSVTRERVDGSRNAIRIIRGIRDRGLEVRLTGVV